MMLEDLPDGAIGGLTPGILPRFMGIRRPSDFSMRVAGPVMALVDDDVVLVGHFRLNLQAIVPEIAVRISLCYYSSRRSK